MRDGAQDDGALGDEVHGRQYGQVHVDQDGGTRGLPLGTLPREFHRKIPNQHELIQSYSPLLIGRKCQLKVSFCFH